VVAAVDDDIAEKIHHAGALTASKSSSMDEGYASHDKSGLLDSFEIHLSSNPDQNFGEGNTTYWINVVTIHDTTDALASPSFVSFLVHNWQFLKQSALPQKTTTLTNFWNLKM
jgi:hypothetical protein